MRHIAIVGSDPAGYYTAEAAQKEFGDDVRVDIFDLLPVPYGLIRSGVAPDHQSIKAVSRRYEKTALSENVRFVGNVAVGRDVSVAELRELYDAVVLATGAPKDRPLDIPGAELGNVIGSAAFVGWYNGHPEFAALDPDLSGKTAVVIGMGNVALDVARILAKTPREFEGSDIVAHALYSEKQIFLRELVSNASDACDRLRYLALSEPGLTAGDSEFRVTLIPDKDKKTLVIADNGIGMNHDELIENLGTIARSGTAAFMQQLSGDQRKDMALIGQFGVGFYSAFMVADRVEVLSRKAGESQAWRWVSDGKGEFAVAAAEDVARGTRIVLHLREDAGEFLEPSRLKSIIARYSDHVSLPILLKAEGKEEKLNEAAALWMRPKSEIGMPGTP